MAAAGEDESLFLEEAVGAVREQGFRMREHIAANRLMDAVQHGAKLVSELRTSLLGPCRYYELYLCCVQELQFLAAYFLDVKQHGQSITELYKRVQHIGNVLPRVYLLATVGSCCAQLQAASIKEVLDDLGEMVRGVQNPLRSMFLRYYLSQIIKEETVIDLHSNPFNRDAGIHYAFGYVSDNFRESLHMWVRMQHIRSTKDPAQAILVEQDRQIIRPLIGSYLVRLSHLEGLTWEFYSDTVLPHVLECVIECSDDLAQQYLLECVVQIFPDSFQLRTLEQVLRACTSANHDVDLQPILQRLMHRLTGFVARGEGSLPQDTDVFGLLGTCLKKVEDDRGKFMSVASLLSLQVSFLSFTLSVYPGNIRHVDFILGSTEGILKRFCGSKKLDSQGVDALVGFLALPLPTLLEPVMEMPHYPLLLGFLNHSSWRRAAAAMVAAILDAGVTIGNLDVLRRFFDCVAPLLHDEAKGDDPNLSQDDFVIEQMQVGKLVHHIRHSEVHTAFEMLTVARDAFAKGGPERMVFTLPPTVVAVLQLVPRIQDGNQQRQEPDLLSKIFEFVQNACTDLKSYSHGRSLSLWLLCASTVDRSTRAPGAPASLVSICQELFTQALAIFEDECGAGHGQHDENVALLVGALQQVQCLKPLDYQGLVERVEAHSMQLAKKTMQCRAICFLSHLFWNPAYREPHRVLECLQRCLKIADEAIQQNPSNVSLFVEVVDLYVYYHEQGNTEVILTFLDSLLKLCTEHILYTRDAEAETVQDARQSFLNLLQYLQRQAKDKTRYTTLDIEKLIDQLQPEGKPFA